MKLNPPETAPKNGNVFPAYFKLGPIRPAIWNDKYGVLVTVLGMGQDDTYFESQDRNPDEMIGWLPLPTIDDEGNVT